MTSSLHWIDGHWPGRLAISARPRGWDWLEGEVAGWRAAGVDVVGSLLTAPEESELGLERERDLCASNSIRFVSLPVNDREVPSSIGAATRFIQCLESELQAGRNVAIHCRQGIGRSGIMAAGLLVAAGVAPDEAISRVSAARGAAVPDTHDQRRWVAQLAAAGVCRH